MCGHMLPFVLHDYHEPSPLWSSVFIVLANQLDLFIVTNVNVFEGVFLQKTEIPHYFCEPAQILKLACSDTHANDVLLYCVTHLLGIISLSGILFSYSKISYSIVCISSKRGKYKAFSTYGSHLSVVIVLWYRPWCLPHFSNILYL